MSIIRNYIIKEWYKFFIGAMLALFILVTIANLISGFLRGNVTSQEVLFNYLLELPSHLNKVLPISCLVASLFSVNKLKSRNELAAIFASGYSRKRFILSIFQASLLIAFIQFVLAAYIQPYAKKNRELFISNSGAKFRNLKSQGLRSNTISSGKLWYKGDNYFFSFLSFEKKKNKITDVKLYFFDDNHLGERIITADYAHHKEDKTWTLYNVEELTWLNKKEFQVQNNYDSREVSINETPADLNQIESDITTLDINSLYLYITQLEDAGININEYKVMLLDKLSSALICVVLSLIALVAIYSPNRRGSSFGRNILYVFTFTLTYWLIYSFSLELGKNSKLNPHVAVFGVPLLFSIYLLYFIRMNRVLR